MSAMVTIEALVARVKMELGLTNASKDPMIETFVRDIITDMKLFVSNEVAVKQIDVTDNNTVPLPKDFLKYSRIATISGGRVCVMTMDQDLEMKIGFEHELCGVTPPEADDNTQYGQWFSYIRNNQYVGERFGATAENRDIPRFRINIEKHRIELASNVSISSVYLEYISSGTFVTEVSRVYLPAIVAYAVWKMAESSRGERITEKERKKKHFEQEYRRIPRVTKAITKEQFLDVIYGTTTPSIKG